LNRANKIVETFTYLDRQCIITKVDILGAHDKNNKLSPNVRNALRPYHNGYVEIRASEIRKFNKGDKIESEWITYVGDLAHIGMKDGKTYFGIDSMHNWNIMHPKSQTQKAVKERLKKVVEELESES